MSTLIRSNALNNIPQKKMSDAIAAIENSEDTLQNKNVKLIAINRYYESNIPIEYWTKKMEKDWVGDPRLLAKYNEYNDESNVDVIIIFFDISLSVNAILPRFNICNSFSIFNIRLSTSLRNTNVNTFYI